MEGPTKAAATVKCENSTNLSDFWFLFYRKYYNKLLKAHFLSKIKKDIHLCVTIEYNDSLKGENSN